MAMRFSYLPFELRGLVFSRLELDDVKNARLACKAFNNAASPFLIARVWLSPHAKDLETLTAIADHEVFSKTVQEIAYDGTWYHDRLLTPSGRERMICGFVKQYPQFSEESVLHALDQYKHDHSQWALLQTYHSESMTRLSDSTPPELRSLLKSAETMHQCSGQDKVQKISQCLPPDLGCLLYALARLPKIRSLTFSDRRWLATYSKGIADQFYTRDDRFPWRFNNFGTTQHSLNSKMILGQQELTIESQGWPLAGTLPPKEHCRGWYRGFFVLVQAVSILGMSRIEKFTVDTASYEKTSGMSHTVFQMNPSEMSHTMRAFQHLTKIKLSISNNAWDRKLSKSWTDTLQSGNIARVLTSARDLTELSLSLDFLLGAVEIQDLTLVFGHDPWPRLEFLSLENVRLYRRQFLSLLMKHKKSLRSLALVRAYTEEDNPDLKCRMRNAISRTFRNMSALHLTRLFVISVRYTEPQDLRDAAAVSRYLLSGGSLHFAEYGARLSDEEQHEWLESELVLDRKE